MRPARAVRVQQVERQVVEQRHAAQHRAAASSGAVGVGVLVVGGRGAAQGRQRGARARREGHGLIRQQGAPSVPLVGGEGQVQRRDVLAAAAAAATIAGGGGGTSGRHGQRLVHDAARQVQHVPRRERELGRVRA